MQPRFIDDAIALSRDVLPPLIIRDKRIKLPIIQGGMGPLFSLYPLAKAVSAQGGLGVISSAGLEKTIKRSGTRSATFEAVLREIQLSKVSNGFTGINIMVAIERYYKDAVEAAEEAGVDVIISGGGLPLDLPKYLRKNTRVALVPIVSSARALKLISLKWGKLGFRPDAVVLEGPLAGGHIGFNFNEAFLESNKLENLLGPVIDVSNTFGGFPVIVAGGIYTHSDIIRFMGMGASGVQMGTRFLVTEESSASLEYKLAVIEAKRDDMVLAYRPGSPCDLPFWVLRNSPMYIDALREEVEEIDCSQGFLLKTLRDGTKYCGALDPKKKGCYFCICSGLLKASGFPNKAKPLYTTGESGYRVEKIMTVSTLLKELVTGIVDN